MDRKSLNCDFSNFKNTKTTLIMSKKAIIKKNEEYYDDKHLNAFYQSKYGAPFTHIGLYTKEATTPEEAKDETIHKIDRLVPKIKKSSKILDLGSGYGESARYLVAQYNSAINCLDISEVQNEHNQKLNKAAEADERITVTQGSFQKIPFPRESIDIVVAQDCLYHSTAKKKAFLDISRVMTSEGRFIFTDIIKKAGVTDDEVEPLLKGLNIKDFGSIKKYHRFAPRCDFEQVYLMEYPDMLTKHYENLLEVLQKNEAAIAKITTKKFVTEKIEETEKWIKLANSGLITWVLIQYQKRNVWI